MTLDTSARDTSARDTSARDTSARAGYRHFRRASSIAMIVGALVGAALPALPVAAAPVDSADTLAPAVRPTSAVQSAPVGRLTPRGCTEGAGTATCELFAMAGTASVLGTSIPIWGFSTTGATGSASAPGPVLVVRQGDDVAITVHNELSGQNVSLALPGQAAAAVTGTAGDDTTGVATGATRTYTFTAQRAGTFSYEAGHTADGARQVAMGLAGALVVLPPDGSAYGAQPGMPSTAYDDDAVLVLSEIDPALNANPAGFDMRNFAPKYRLINGKPYPAADPISTDQGHHVLLRYVNAGAQMHAMSVLGGDQVEIAQDGHPMKFTTTVTAESIEPGQTLDTTVQMPTGPEAKIAVYEPSGHLDNNGQTNGDPLQLATGGMLTFLDTNAPPPSTDGVGPVSSHLRVSPNPSDGRADVTVTADLSDAGTGGSPVTQAEFVVDDAVTTGVGFGVAMTGPFGAVDVAGASGTIPATVTPCDPATGPPPVSLNCLSAGKHAIYVRALDAAGNWGVIGSAILNLPKTGPQTTNGSATSTPANGTAAVDISATGDDSAAGGTINGAEYFVDTIGASGTGTALALNRAATIVSEDAVLTAAGVAALAEGVHHVYVHSLDSLNLWGPTLDIPLTVDLTGPAVDAASVGPNPSNGVLSDKSNPGYLLVSAQLTDKDAGGAAQSPLADAEAFLDPKTATPPEGTGLQLVAVDGKLNATTEAVYGLIPISQIKALADGEHHVYVRGQDAAGNWGPLFAVSLTVDKTAPVLGAMTATPNPTGGAATLTVTAPVTDATLIAAAEYWLGAVDPGVGRGSSLPVSVVNGKIVVTVPLGAAPAGSQQVNLRVQDLAGNWSKAGSVSVIVQKPNSIFTNRFEPTDFGAWGATGNVASTAAAAIPNPNETGTTRGLQVTMPGGRSNRASYVTDTTPTGESTYHVRFAFDPSLLASTTAVTVFEARSAANTQVFTVQYRVSGGVRQIRTVLSRTSGAALSGAWVNLGSGAHILRMDWAAAAAGTLTLSVDGATASTLSGDTNSLRVDTVSLGVIAGFSLTSVGGTAGRAYFDTFESARTSLP